MSDDIQLEVGGRSFAEWKEVSFARSVEALSGAFKLVLFDPQARPMGRGDKVQLKLGRDVVSTGAIDALAVTVSGDEHRVEVRGRDRTGDLVDTSIDNLPSEWVDQTLYEIVLGIAFHGYRIPVRTLLGRDNPTFDRFALQPGETAGAAIERACRLKGVLAYPAADGALVIARPSAEVIGPDLVQGENILALRGNFDDSDRFNYYKVVGQHSGSDVLNGASAAAPWGFAEDPGVRNTRVHVILAEGQVDAAECKRRALWEASMRAARAARVSVDVLDWRVVPQGPLWQVNRLVNIAAPAIHYFGQLRIESVNHRLDSRGKITTLGLVRPDAYEASPELTLERDPGAPLLKALGVETDGGGR